MVITELYLKNFGKFAEQHFYLHDGLQVISGENEFGKSTLHAFIRAMLFGLERGRGRAAAKDEFTRYEPWENPGYYAGVMRFTCGGRNFRLERDFSRAAKKVSLVCEDDGEELSVERGDLNMLLGGLTPGLFDSTISVGQLRAEPGQELFDALENHAANYFATGSGEIDIAGTFQLLKEKRRQAARALQEEEAARAAEQEKILQECRYLERDMKALQDEFAEKQTRLNALENVDDAGIKAGNSAKNLFFMGSAGVLAGFAGFLWSRFISGRTLTASAFPVAVIAGVIALAGVLLLIAGGIAVCRAGREKGRPKADEDRVKQLQWEMEHIQAEWKEKMIRCGNLREQCEETEVSEVQKNLLRRQQALEMAEEELRKAVQETGNQTAGLMQEKASAIFASVTEGAYLKIMFDGERHISVWDGTRKIPAERLSRGTIEQIYLAVRLAAAEVVLEEPMPLILDDVFAFYDDKRLLAALKWLSGQGKQVIIFTCHKREEEIVKREIYR